MKHSKFNDFDNYSKSYEFHIKKALPSIVQNVDRFAKIKSGHFLAALNRNCPTPCESVVLDAGCGIGLMDGHLRPHVGRIVGLDISENSIQVARSNNPEVDYVAFGGGDFPFEDGGFDAVFAACVVHHVPPEAWPDFFAEIHRVLKPGGLMVIFEHNPWNPLTRWVVARCEFDRDAHLLSAPKSRQLAAGAGFGQVALRHYLFLPIELPIWLGIESTLLSRLPIGAQYMLTATRS